MARFATQRHHQSKPRTSTLTFIDVPRTPGSSQIKVNVLRGRNPFGAIYTYAARPGDKHPWHAQPLYGEHKYFFSRSAAQEYMEGLATR